MTSLFRAPLALLPLAAMALAGCTDSSTAPVGGSRAMPDTRLPATDLGLAAVSCLNECSWSQGQPALMMGSAASRACFLSMVGGHFKDTSEWVGVTVWLGRWYLSGSSNQSGVRATARCIAAGSFTDEVTVKSAAPDVMVAKPLDGSACGLTRVGGGFDDVSDMVQIYSNQLIAYSNDGSSVPVTASARCASDPVEPVGMRGYWQSPGPFVTLAPPWVRLCVLTGMRGSFVTSGNYVGTKKTDTDWRLLGAQLPGFDSIGGWAACML